MSVKVYYFGLEKYEKNLGMIYLEWRSEVEKVGESIEKPKKMLEKMTFVITGGNWRRGLNLRPREKGLNYTNSVELREGPSGRRPARWAEPRPKKRVCVKREWMYRYQRCSNPMGPVIWLNGALTGFWHCFASRRIFPRLF